MLELTGECFTPNLRFSKLPLICEAFEFRFASYRVAAIITPGCGLVMWRLRQCIGARRVCSVLSLRYQGSLDHDHAWVESLLSWLILFYQVQRGLGVGEAAYTSTCIIGE